MAEDDESSAISLFAPDEVKETFTPRTDHGGHDRNGRSLRYLLERRLGLAFLLSSSLVVRGSLSTTRS